MHKITRITVRKTVQIVLQIGVVLRQRAPLLRQHLRLGYGGTDTTRQGPGHLRHKRLQQMKQEFRARALWPDVMAKVKQPAVFKGLFNHLKQRFDHRRRHPAIDAVCRDIVEPLGCTGRELRKRPDEKRQVVQSGTLGKVAGVFNVIGV